MSRYRVLVVAAALAGSACGDGVSADVSAPVKPLDSYTLRAPVDVVEDGQSVPHLYAESDWDAIFAQGHRVRAAAPGNATLKGQEKEILASSLSDAWTFVMDASPS